MSESLTELLRRSADSVREPLIDVGELVAAAGRRQRRRRLAIAAGAAGIAGAIVVGSLAFRSNPSSGPDPAPSPPPAPSPSVAVDTTEDGTRPLVYATGSTVHVGDQTFDAGGAVGFLDVTDDGVLFVNQDDERLWFNDGTTTREIGRVQIGPGGFSYVPVYVSTANPGAWVVWEDAASRTQGFIDQFVVYDTSRREVVARIPFVGHYNQLLHVDDGHVYFNPDKGSPGCWVFDIQFCDDPHVLRYDLGSGETTKISQTTLEAELTIVPRMLVLSEPQAQGDSGTRFTVHFFAWFKQVASRLDPRDSGGGDTVFTRTNGGAIRLRVPSGYTAPGGEDGGIRLSQWLDDDRIVLEASDGNGDTGPSHGDLLVCRLPDGVCAVALRDATFVVPG